MSTFVAHHTHSLLLSTPPPTASGFLPPSEKKDELHALLGSLKPPLTSSRVRDTLQILKDLELPQETAAWADEEEEALKNAVLGKVAVGLYAEVLEGLLGEALEVQNEAEWWGEVERSRTGLVVFLVQTLPERIANLTRTVFNALRDQHVPMRPSAFTPRSLRRVLSTSSLASTTTYRPPPILASSLFPHLHTHPHSLSLSLSVLYRPSGSAFHTTVNSLQALWFKILEAVNLPLELTRQECKLKKRELEKIRDERAEALGTLSSMRPLLAGALEEQSQGTNPIKLYTFIEALQRITQGRNDPVTSPVDRDDNLYDSVLSSDNEYGDRSTNNAGKKYDLLASLTTLADHVLPSHKAHHTGYLNHFELYRPSRLTLAWPRILLVPPLVIYGARVAYASRASLKEMAGDAWGTLGGFWKGWLVEPVREMLKTVRAGGEGGVIVRKEGVDADLESLERMVIALAKEKLSYGQDQLDVLSRQIRVGDLTPVMQIYEEDIKSPVKSVVAGTLLRSAFIQVQKAKVDIDQALTGIDKLLKSQELTFAFVGVAPALAVVYIVGGYFKNAWSGGKGRGRYGGKKKRASAWLTMRRIERLLISQPPAAHQSHKGSSSSISPLTSGLLLLSVAHLRNYADKCLPQGSRIREGFLEDVEDLEDPALGRGEKLRVIDRMWKSWGNVLGWGTLAER